MNAPKEKQRLPSPDGTSSCSICLEAVESAGKRSVARLKCGHLFHLDCIGSAFNAKGAMQCPNCRQVEGGQWLYSSGSLLQQEDFARNDYARMHLDMAYLHNERVESFDEAPRWSTHSYRHNLVSQREDQYSTEDQRQHQGVPRYQTGGDYMPRYQTGGDYMPRNPGFDLVHVAPASEMARRSADPVEIAIPLHQDLRPSRASAMYLQSLQPMMPRSYEQSHANMLPEFYPSHVLERLAYRRRMDDGGYEEHSGYRWPVGRRHSTHRVPSDMGGAFNPTQMHVLPDFGLQGHMSSLERSNIRTEVAIYGHFSRRAGSYPSYVSNGLDDLASRNFGNGYDGHNSHFNNLEANWMGRGVPQP